MIGDAQNVCLTQQFMLHEGDTSNFPYSHRAYNWQGLTTLLMLGLLSAWSRCSPGCLIAAAAVRLEAKVSL